MRAIAAREFPGLDIELDSAGTADYHVGEPPDRRTVAAARRRGYDISGLRARQVQPADFDRFDFVLAGAREECSWHRDGGRRDELRRALPVAAARRPPP